MRSSSLIKIPVEAWSDVEEYLAAPVDGLDALVAAAVVRPPAPDVEDLAEACAAYAGLSAAAATSALTLAIHAARVRHRLELTVSETPAVLAEALGRSFGEKWTAERQTTWEQRAPLLERLIADDGPLEAMAKARDLLFDFQALLAVSTVVTDVRHVYDTAGTRVIGGMVLHTVGLRFVEDGQAREMHFTLSAHAVRELKAQLERALRKEETTVRFLAAAGVPELTPKRDGSE